MNPGNVLEFFYNNSNSCQTFQLFYLFDHSITRHSHTKQTNIIKKPRILRFTESSDFVVRECKQCSCTCACPGTSCRSFPLPVRRVAGLILLRGWLGYFVPRTCRVTCADRFHSGTCPRDLFHDILQECFVVIETGLHHSELMTLVLDV